MSIISNVGSGMSYSPSLDNAKLLERSAQQRAIAEKIIQSLPGNSGRNNEKSCDIRHIAADVEQISQTFNKKLKFVVDHQSNEVIVKVIDKSTDKVIKVLPPEELQRLHRKIKETIGFLFNEEI